MVRLPQSGAHKLRACDICASIKQVCERPSPHDTSVPCVRCARMSTCSLWLRKTLKTGGGLELACTITRVHKPMGRPRRARPVNTAAAEPPSSSVSAISRPALYSSSTGIYVGTPDDEALQFFDQFLVLPSPQPQDPVGGSPPECPPLTPSPSPSSSSTPASKPGPVRTKTRIRRSTSGMGCFSCKRRRKKCNEVLPVCGECSRLGLECTRPPARAPSSSAVVVSQHAPPLPQHLSILPGFGQSEAHLLRHYTDVVVQCLSVIPSAASPFISLFVPMVVSQPVTRKALLCLSACHLKRQHEGFASEMIRYRDESFVEAVALVGRPDRDSLTQGLAAILLLCIQEVCEGRSRRWPRHLAAAVNIIHMCGGPAAFPPGLRFLIEATAYFDSIATLSFSRSPLLDPACYLPLPGATAPAGGEHALFGASHELIAIIARLGTLSQDRFRRFASADTFQQFNGQVAELEFALQAWTPPETASAVHVAVSIALQWAALMRLHQLAAGYDVYHPRIRVAVSNILEAVDTIPDYHDVESMLVFPMFMAGVGAVEEERDRVRRRFGVMKGSVGFGNVYDAMDVLEVLWRRMEEDCVTGMRWEELVEEDGGSLILS